MIGYLYGEGNLRNHYRFNSYSSSSYLHERASELLWCDVQNFWVKHASIIIDLLQHQTIGERRNSQHVQQGCF